MEYKPLIPLVVADAAYEVVETFFKDQHYLLSQHTSKDTKVELAMMLAGAVEASPFLWKSAGAITELDKKPELVEALTHAL